MATGVPIPSDSNVSRNNDIRGRELRLCLFEKRSNKFVGGSITIPMAWKQEYEDRWYPPTKADDNVIIVKIRDFAEKKDSQLCLCFEFVIHFVKNNQCIELSCGYSTLDLMTINSTSSLKLSLDISGGAPNKLINIRPDDVKANRKGFAAKVMKKISKAVTSKLALEVNGEKKMDRKRLVSVFCIKLNRLLL